MKRVAIITSSDAGYAGEREDKSGPAIKEIAENGYALSSANVHSKDEKFQKIIGMCNAVIMVLKEN